MWKGARDWLKAGGAIPEDDVLRTDLTSPETVARVDGLIQLESKEDMKARGLQSPNRADALAISFAYPVVAKKDEAAPRGRRHERARTEYDPYAPQTADSGGVATEYDPYNRRDGG
jgi:hypothetical protein